MGRGAVHHIAFRTANEKDQPVWQKLLTMAGYPTSAIRDRQYFKSIYFNEPSGVLFEIATDPPGFAVDEAPSELGNALKLPAQYEAIRSEIERALPPLSSPDFRHRFTSPPADDSGITLVALHGTGGDENDLLPVAADVAPDAAVLSPRGKVVENGMARFFKRYAPGVFDEQEVLLRANELADFLERAAGRYGRSPDKLFALGYSNGANIAAAILFARPELFTGAILLRPMLPLPRFQPGDLTGKKILVLRGLKDQIIPAESTDLLIERLATAGAEIKTVAVNSGHQLTEKDINTARDWLGDHAMAEHQR
jgi:predicted esterase